MGISTDKPDLFQVIGVGVDQFHKTLLMGVGPMPILSTILTAGGATREASFGSPRLAAKSL
jgi:hypothetical protein